MANETQRNPPSAGTNDIAELVFGNAELSDSLLGLIGCVSEHLNNPNILKEASDALQSLGNSEGSTIHSDPEASLELLLVQQAIYGAKQFCTLPESLSKKKTWNHLQETANKLCAPSPEASALAVCALYAVLALLPFDYDPAKAVASATASAVSRQKAVRHGGKELANNFLRAFLVHATYSDTVNLQIVTYFAKAFKISEDEEHAHAELSAKVIQHALRLEDSDMTSLDPNAMSTETISTESEKQRVSSAIALACQVRPWPMVSPVSLVEAAVQYDFWHAAEQICNSAHQYAKVKHSDIATEQAITAVETLVDLTMEARMHRQADTFATNLYDKGGKSRYIEARLCHAYDTIAKVIVKRQVAIIERQVDRVDKAVAKVNDPVSSEASKEVRQFALHRLEEAGEVDSAHRLADLWKMDFLFDEQAMLEAAAARRKRYLQWDDVLPAVPIPELISTPEDLRVAWQSFRVAPFEYGPFGFDAEWEEDTNGAALLQLGHCKDVLLIDLPALSSTPEGLQVMQETVGELFACPKSAVVGFVCRQDMSRLRSSPCCLPDQHWMPSPLKTVGTVIDAQRCIAKDDPTLSNFGLSRASEHYFGKPLDKAEQCSLWSSRPLSERQRVYAALDAWTCAALHKKLFPTWRTRGNREV